MPRSRVRPPTWLRTGACSRAREDTWRPRSNGTSRASGWGCGRVCGKSPDSDKRGRQRRRDRPRAPAAAATAHGRKQARSRRRRERGEGRGEPRGIPGRDPGRSERADEALDPFVVRLERVLAEDGLSLRVVELQVHPIHPVVLALEVRLTNELAAQA